MSKLNSKSVNFDSIKIFALLFKCLKTFQLRQIYFSKTD